MKEYVIDCTTVESEQQFWEQYVRVVHPDGAELFGRNLDAFWDAVSAGGPGWPGECRLRFTHTQLVQQFRNGFFYSALKRIEQDCQHSKCAGVSVIID